MTDTEKESEHLANRAEMISTTLQEQECPDCFEELLFAMRDQHHDFSLGLGTVLQCLQLAEQNGYVPELPDEWWIQLRLRYEYVFRI